MKNKFTNHEIFEAFEKVSKMYGWDMHFGSDGRHVIENELSKYALKDITLSFSPLSSYFQLYKEAVDKWGKKAQILMAIEEMGELIVELAHEIRGRGDVIKISEEMADTVFMFEQLKYVFKNEDIINAFLIQKKERLVIRLKEN